MKQAGLLLVLCLCTAALPAQDSTRLTLEDCYRLAQQNYPLIRQQELIAQTRDYSIENIGRGYLPQLAVSGQATYQTQTISFPFAVPNAKMPEFSKDQYRLQAEIDQTIYDGGTLRYQQQQKKTEAAIQQQQLETDLYALKDRINQLFFGILLAAEQTRQQALQLADIQNGIDKVQAALDNGTAFRSSLDELKAEWLKASQAGTSLQYIEQAYRTMLLLFIGLPSNARVTLVKPAPVQPSLHISRPELVLFDYRKKTYDIQDKQRKAAYLPKVSAFVQGAYGRPTLNFISNSFGFWGIGGIKLSWPLYPLYTAGNDKKLLALGRKNLDIQKETFLFNTRLTLAQQNTEAEKNEALITTDKKIVALRHSVTNAAKAQLENGVITAHDYISQVNAETQARLSLALHEIELLQAQYNSKTTSGN
jgi:outer membrane protein TolC